MKKILILVLFISVILLVSCEKGIDSTTQTNPSTATTSSESTISNEITTTSISTLQTIEQETTIIDHEAIKSNVEDKIVFYKTKLIELSGLEEEMIESELSFNNNYNIMLLSTSYDEYNRDDLPEQVPFVYEGNGIDPEFIINTTFTINEYLAVLDLCEDFEEDSFMETSYDSFNYLIKTSVDGDQLYIESYRFYQDSGSDVFWADIMYFDMVDDKMIFKYVRDYNSSQHSIYYDEFSETGDAISIALDADNEELTYYQVFDRDINMTFDLSNTSIGGVYMNYNAIDGSIFYCIKIGEDESIIRHSIRYGSPTQFWYTNDEGEVYLTWNLYSASGWNKCRIYSSADDHIFMDDTEVLQDFTISISIQDVYANARFTTTEALFTESMMNLSDYGLYFAAVTYTQLQLDIDYIDQNFLSIINEYGLSLNMSDNYNNLISLFPFTSDSTVIEEISD